MEGRLEGLNFKDHDLFLQVSLQRGRGGLGFQGFVYLRNGCLKKEGHKSPRQRMDKSERPRRSRG